MLLLKTKNRGTLWLKSLNRSGGYQNIKILDHALVLGVYAMKQNVLHALVVDTSGGISYVDIWWLWGFEFVSSRL